MNKLSQMGKWIVVVGGLVLVVALVAVFGWGGSSGVVPNNNGGYGTNTETSTASTTPGTGTQNIPNNGIPAGAPIIFSTPVPGETWKIAAQNLVSWSREGNVSGQIELLDATTKKLVGVILNQTGPHQTSYTWNTRDLSLSRTNAQKTTVLPGRYVIRISFDGNNLPPITSQPIILAK